MGSIYFWTVKSSGVVNNPWNDLRGIDSILNDYKRSLNDVTGQTTPYFVKSLWQTSKKIEKLCRRETIGRSSVEHYCYYIHKTPYLKHYLRTHLLRRQVPVIAIQAMAVLEDWAPEHWLVPEDSGQWQAPSWLHHLHRQADLTCLVNHQHQAAMPQDDWRHLLLMVLLLQAG